MLGLLPQPKIQVAEATIITLCDRLTNSTMLEDRRAAVLALKGFSHDHRELVAANGMRGLISTLKRDRDDTETLRATLETFIVLFVKSSNVDSTLAEQARRVRQRNKRYLSPLLVTKKKQVNEPRQVDDIALWLTDEFTHDNESLLTLLEFINSNDMFTSMYSLQLLSAMVLSRNESVKQSLFSVHHGISTLVSALDSKHEMVRNETVLLLLNLTSDHLDFQKLVAFEGAFEKIFAIIDYEGGVLFGGVTVESCLDLLSNLLQYNVSNQKLFCETKCVSKYGKMLDVTDNTNWSEQACANMTSALQLARLFMIPDGESTKSHQDVFEQANISVIVLKLAFGPTTSLPVRVGSLLTVASLVHNNGPRQDELLSMDVPYYDLSISLNVQLKPSILPLSQALLNWALDLPSKNLFNLRAASQMGLHALFKGNESAGSKFVNDQVAAYKDLTSQANLIQTLAEYDDDLKLNPFKVWFAAAITMDLLQGSQDLQDHLLSVTIGDPELGQDELGIIQAISGQLLASFDLEDFTVTLAYLMLLSVWLYDNVKAVNAFVSDLTVLRSVLTYATTVQAGASQGHVKSLATILLGISYDFCGADSPFNRMEFHSLLKGTMGSDQYMLSIQRFSESTEYKEYDPNEIFDPQIRPNGLPWVYFDFTYISLIRDNINRIKRAIERDPTVEPSSRVSLEMYDELKMLFADKERELQDIERRKDKDEKTYRAAREELEASLTATMSSLENITKSYENASEQLSQLKKTHDLTSEELASLKKEHANLRDAHNENKKEFDSTEKELGELKTRHNALESQLKLITSGKEKAEEGVNKLTRELMTLSKEKKEAEITSKELILKADKSSKELEAAHKRDKDWVSKFEDLQQSSAQEKEATFILKEANTKLINKLKEAAKLLEEKDEIEEQLEVKTEKLEKAEAGYKKATARLQSLEKEIQLMRTKLDEYKKVSATAVEQLKEKNASLDALQQELDKLRSEPNEGTKQLRDDQRERVESLQRELEDAHAQSAKEVEKLKDTHRQVLGQALSTASEHKSARKKLEAKLEELDSDKNRSNESARIEELVKAKAGLDHDAEQRSKEIESLKAELALRKNSTEGNDITYKKDLDASSKESSALVESHAKELGSLNNAISELRQNHEDSKKHSELESTVLEKQIESYRDEIDNLKAELEHSRKASEEEGAQKSQVCAEFEALRAQVKDLTARLEAAEASSELSELREQLKMAKAKAKSSSADVEDLMLLVDDATKHKDEYKNRLRSLNEDVSDSDEEADETK